MKQLRRAVAVLVIGLVGVVAVAPSEAHAQTPEQRTRARELYADGQREFTAEHYTEALAAYQAAYQQVQNPLVLLAIAQAQERLGQRAEARATLEQYLHDRADAPDRADVEARIAALPAPTTGTIHVACSPTGAAISVDGTAHGTAPADVVVAAGTHEVQLTLEGYTPFTRSVTVAAGARVEITTELVTASVASQGTEDDAFGSEGADDGDEAETATMVPETSVSTDPSAGVWVTTAVAGVALVTGTVFGFLALSRQSDFDAMPTRSAADEGEAFALVADLSFGIAAAAGITAIVLYATERPAPAAAATDEEPAATTASVRVLPFASPQGGGAVLTTTF